MKRSSSANNPPQALKKESLPLENELLAFSEAIENDVLPKLKSLDKYNEIKKYSQAVNEISIFLKEKLYVTSSTINQCMEVDKKLLKDNGTRITVLLEQMRCLLVQLKDYIKLDEKEGNRVDELFSATILIQEHWTLKITEPFQITSPYTDRRSLRLPNDSPIKSQQHQGQGGIKGRARAYTVSYTTTTPVNITNINVKASTTPTDPTTDSEQTSLKSAEFNL